MNFFNKNLETKGRVVRGTAALALATGAIFTWSHSRPGSIALIASSVFVGFEAARGWCALRACGIKTKL